VGTGEARENGEIGVVVQDAKNPKRLQATISTLREISPQNHDSSVASAEHDFCIRHH
jgi:hypothetical protein